MENNTVILEAKHISKDFHDPVNVRILDDISLSINRGEFVSVVGRSGCGKSTLLYVLSTLDTDYEGELYIDGVNMQNKKGNQLAHIRNEKVGFVFQFHYLLNEFNVLNNVMLPALKLNRYSYEKIKSTAEEKLKILDIGKLAMKKPNQLSGGEKQRVAIARALINDPDIIMCDEPTGNLDKKNSDIVFNIFQQLAKNFSQTLLVVTHDNSFAERTERIIEMEDGQIVRESGAGSR